MWGWLVSVCTCVYAQKQLLLKPKGTDSCDKFRSSTRVVCIPNYKDISPAPYFRLFIFLSRNFRVPVQVHIPASGE